jgi:acyl dehydratase
MSLETVRAELGAQIGQDIHVSDWVDITQERVDAFATATERSPVDPHEPDAGSGGISLEHDHCPRLSHAVAIPDDRGIVEEGRPAFPGLRQVINYGLNKVRFTNAVKVGARVRGRSKLVAIDDFKGGFMLTEEFTMEIEGEKKPACVAEILMRYYF